MTGMPADCPSQAPPLRQQALSLILLKDADAKAEAVRALPAVNRLSPQDLEAVLAEPAGVPGRPSRPVLRPPYEMKNRAVGTPEGRAAMFHALAHIESNAVDLALDVVWRFAGMPEAFYLDWLQVAREEALHFNLLHEHLKTLGFAYGDFPAHTGLWDMAEKTKADLLARMALVPRTLEARGLDASPAIRNKLISVGDQRGGEIIDLILRDEIGHVAIGNRWYRHLCVQRGLDPLPTYAALASRYGAPVLKGPFNLAARRAAGFAEDELALLGAPTPQALIPGA
jgi:uncharacterized ferritin-like protein (DUF455 family)